MTALRDDMTLEEVQAEAERRWPGAVLIYNQRHDHHELCIPVPLPGIYYEAQTPVGCLDQAIAAEARRVHHWHLSYDYLPTASRRYWLFCCHHGETQYTGRELAHVREPTCGKYHAGPNGGITKDTP